MRSPLDIDPTDLTAKARIRQAAIKHFATEGFSVSLRTIAAAAGVSAALVVKLYGSKDGLRAACDEAVFNAIRETKLGYLAPGTGEAGALKDLSDATWYYLMLLYALRALQSGGQIARDFVDHLVADAMEYTAMGVQLGLVRPSQDEAARVRYLMLASLGHMLLSALCADPAETTTAEFWQRYVETVMPPVLEVYAEGVLLDRSLFDKYLLYRPDPPERAP